jgi:flagellar FliL protein
MAAAPPEPATPDAAPPKRALAAALPTVIALVAGLALGGAGGAFAVGPALADGIAPAGGARHAAARGAAGDAATGDGAAHGDAGEAGDADGKDAKGDDAKAAPVYTMENLVLNPAESGGSRFLLFSLAFELRDQAAHDAMKARDAEMRDVVLAALGRRTTEQLADMALRDSLKAEVGAAAARQLGKRGGVRRVYFPQFVIQ